MAEQFARQLRETLATIATALQLSPSLYPCEDLKAGSVEEFGPPEDRELAICRNIERYIDYITATDGSVTKDLRFIVIDFVPRFLLAYQALRFQPISGEDTASMPTKDTLAEFPAIVVDTGLYMPVSKLLRLVAVSLIDGESKQRLVDSGNSKALMSHMVDDPLNPLQRECAVFAVNVLTRDFEPAQRVISEIMSNRMEYVGYALSPDCQPDKFDGELAEETLDRSVLDDRCQAVPNFLSKAQELLKDDFQLDSNTKQLLSVLAESLSRFNMSEQTFVLSLSGGVDSMSLLVLLLKLKIKFAAVHIRHSSRLEDTAKELQWVQFVCKTLGVTLYYHHVLVARPHATSDVTESELSREAFEDYTRQIRFGMYRKAFDQYSTNSENSPALVLIGHHLDDIDENRIAELGKGNLINIDGMAEDDGDDGSSDKKRGVVVLRPLCSFIRKDQLRQFAQTFNIPHMRNSTPKWSKRGWIRDALDDPSFDRDSTLEQLDSLGRASRDLDQSLETAVERWLELGGITCERTMHVISKSKEFSLSCSTLHLGALESELTDVIAQMRKVGEMCNDFSSRWNLKVEEFCRSEDRKNMSCPIQKIRFWNIDDETEFRTVILTRAFQKAFIKLQSAIPGLERYIAKKSMGQLVENLSSKSMKAWINWKLNNFKHEVPIIQYAQGNLAFPDCDQVDSITEELFAGNREALKKTIASNIHRITIS